jgi:hypothetical protein
LATRYSTASALSRVPRAVGKSTCASPRDGSRNHAFNTVIVGLAERHTPFFPSLADHPHVRARADGDIIPRERRQFGQTKPCLDGYQEQRMIAPRSGQDER